MVPVGRLTIVRTFAKSELIRAMSFVAIPGLIGPMLGPIAGGLIVGYLHWRVIFFINLPVGLLGLYLVYRLLPDYRKEQSHPLDTVGLVLDTNSAGQHVVRAVSSSASTMTHQNILPGDIIMQITGFEPAPYTLAEASRGLSGEVGERKNLAILRQGKLLSVTVDVSRIL